MDTSLFERLSAILSSADPRAHKARRIAELLREECGYHWVGVYEVDSAEIAAIAWSGPTAPAYPRFPASKGLCGEAVRTGEIIVVNDVATDPRYLTTFTTTRSEIAVPIKHPIIGRTIGIIDAESELPHAFAPADCNFLEDCALMLGAFIDSH
ncbi:GAF domain-containing protein [Ktedonosporobacter rubrisoli]|nr:GAF domain-containing protein [Ktedonosporobacter rubrisoli]